MGKDRTLEIIKTEIERLKGICTAQIKANPGQTFPFVMIMTGYDKILSFLDTLEEDRPEPYNPVYDEAYLNEKIKKATESWKGVDVDAMLAECRGYDEEKSEKPMNQEGLEEAVIDYFEGYWPGMETPEQCNTHLQFTPPAIMRLARHFAQWGAEHAKIDVTDFCKPIDPGIAQCIADHSWEMLGEDEKPVPNDLEEKSEIPTNLDELLDDYFEKLVVPEHQIIFENTYRKIATDFYEFGETRMKEQMMKEAMEGKIGELGFHNAVYLQEQKWTNILDGFKKGDKVRIIIVKEDEK